jgi:mercuric reductase
MAKRYDLIIIGNGAASFAAAIKATELSEGTASILMVGIGPIGGTCVNVGCIPSKYLLEISHSYFYSNKKKYQGLVLEKAKLDFKEVMEGLRNFVLSLRKTKYEDVLKAYPNIEYIEGKAKFISNNEIEVNGKNFSAENIIIATGSRPSIPNIEGLNKVNFFTSNNIWEINNLPSRIAIIGGGAIGLEIGQAFQHFGSQVFVIEAMDRIVPQAEPELSKYLMNILEEEGMKFYLKARISRIEQKSGSKILEVLTAKGKEFLEVDEILVATGRNPNTEELRLDKANVVTDKRGFIITNEMMQTSNPKIYAAGDCVSKRLMLETLAAREGVIAANNIFGIKSTIDYNHVPWVVFTNPQLASVGYLEHEFVNKFGSCVCNIVRFKDVPKALIMNEEGLIKIVADPNSGKIVGLHVLGYMASEYIIEGALAIKLGLTINDIIDTVHAFPTLSESIKLAAQSFLRNISMMSCCVE